MEVAFFEVGLPRRATHNQQQKYATWQMRTPSQHLILPYNAPYRGEVAPHGTVDEGSKLNYVRAHATPLLVIEASKECLHEPAREMVPQSKLPRLWPSG